MIKYGNGFNQNTLFTVHSRYIPTVVYSLLSFDTFSIWGKGKSASAFLILMLNENVLGWK